MIKDSFLLSILKKNKKLLIENENLFIKLSEVRNNVITKDWVGLKVSVYNGKLYVPLKIIDDMVGKKFGLFSFTKSILIKKKVSKYADKYKKKKK